jgi:hypothetical protein
MVDDIFAILDIHNDDCMKSTACTGIMLYYDVTYLRLVSLPEVPFARILFKVLAV